MFEMDELSFYRGRDIYITEKIIITQPTLDQIERFGENKYFNGVCNLTSVAADFKWQLWDYFDKTDYTTISDYELFIKLIYQLVSSKKNIYNELTFEEKSELSDDEVKEMLVNPLSLVLNIDLADFVPCKSNKNDEIILYNLDNDITIDRMIYSKIVDVVRRIHGFKRNNQIPANERTKMDLIDDARDEAMLNASKPHKSVLLPLISALSVKCGQCGDENIWNMKINMFFDNIKRMNKIQDAQLLLQGAYSGFTSLKGIDKSRLEWAGDI